MTWSSSDTMSGISRMAVTAERAADIVAKEAELVDVFRKKGLNVTDPDRNDFRDTVLKNVKFEDYGYRKADWDKIQAVKSGSGT